MSDITSSSTNTVTGSQSTNTNSLTTTNTSTVSVTNSATTSNTATISVNSGVGDISNNTSVSNVSGGNSSVSLDITTKQNANTVAQSSTTSPANDSVTITGSNKDTGSQSSNSNTVSITNHQLFSQNNSADITNAITVSANASLGDITGNTSVQNVHGGNVTVQLAVSNQANTNTGIGGGQPETPSTPAIPETPVATVTTNTPSTPSTEFGIGGDFLPLPITTTAANVPRFFASGADSFTPQIVLVLLIAGLSLFGKKLVKPLRRFLRIAGAGAVTVLLILSPLAATITHADDSSSSAQTTVGPTEPVGPQGPVGPTEPVGPTKTVDPTTDTQTQTTVAASSTPAPVIPDTTVSGSTALSNTSTGSNSTNTNSDTTNNSSSIATANGSTLNNSIDATANTGGTTVAQNTNVGDVQTGDINGVVNVINVGNSVFAPGSTVGSASVNGGTNSVVDLSTPTDRTALPSTDMSNSNTGANSANTNVLQGTNTLSIVNSNQATANNAAAIQANTGNNALLQNTQVDDLKTGDINLAVNFVNLLNAVMPTTKVNVDVWSVLLNNPDATINLANTNTGANSANSNALGLNQSNGITVSNAAVADNGLTVSANTGDNSLNGNSQVGNVSTGSANVAGRVVNIANANVPTVYLLNVFGPWDGTLQGVPANSVVIDQMGNILTGAGSLNSNNAVSNNSASYSLTNQAAAHNSLVLSANTGDNQLTQNTAVKGVQTGSINVLANFINLLNGWGGDLSQFHLGILNIFSKPTVSGTPADTSVPQNVTVVGEGVGGGTVLDLADLTAPAVTVGGTHTPIVLHHTTTTPNSVTSTSSVSDGTAVVDLAVQPTSASTPVLSKVSSSLADVAKAAENSATSTKDQARRLPWGIIILGLIAGTWISIELLANAEKRRKL